MLLPSYYCFFCRLTFKQIPLFHIYCQSNLSKIKYYPSLFLNYIKLHNTFENETNTDLNNSKNISLILNRIDDQWDEGEIPWDIDYLLPSNEYEMN
jgi:hypothetical protein